MKRNFYYYLIGSFGWLASGLCAWSTAGLAADSLLYSREFWRDAADHFAGDLVSGIYEPLAGRFNWPAVATAGATVAVSYSLYDAVDDSQEDLVLLTDDATVSDIVNAFSFTAYATPLAFLVGGWFFPAADARRRRTWQVAEELFETLGFSVVTMFALKFSIDRSNPTGNGTHSFPSGHASAAFAAATIIAYHYPWYAALAALGVAALIAVERFDTREHFPSDLVAGAGIGLFWAQAVHAYHRSLRANPERRWLGGLTPLINERMVGVSWRKEF